MWLPVKGDRPLEEAPLDERLDAIYEPVAAAWSEPL
jgi:hypothetical protein